MGGVFQLGDEPVALRHQLGVLLTEVTQPLSEGRVLGDRAGETINRILILSSLDRAATVPTIISVRDSTLASTYF